MTASAALQAPPALRGFESTQRFYDAVARTWTAHVMPGDFYVTREDEVLSTVLGSCVSVCMRDARLGMGGMNHFMLPGAEGGNAPASMRYGLVALERLINELVKYGGHRERFEVKLFGGGRVIGGNTDVGRSNIEFVHQYLREEGFGVTAEDLGGTFARRLRYHPVTGAARVMRMDMGETRKVAQLEQRKAVELQAARPPDVELF